MGKYKHHSGAISGGVNLSKGKTPHDSLMKYMPIDDKASSLFKMGKPYSMGESMRGPLDKHGKHSDSVAYKMMDQPVEFNEGLKKASKDGKLDNNPKFKAAVDASGMEMRGPLNQEDPEKNNMENKKKCKPGFKMHNGECVKIGTKVSGFGQSKK